MQYTETFQLLHLASKGGEGGGGREEIKLSENCSVTGHVEKQSWFSVFQAL